MPIASRKHEHYRYGWIQVCCPFCGDGNFHLGYNVSKGYFNCYRCGSHGLIETLALICDVRYNLEQRQLIAKVQAEEYEQAPSVQTP